jgi:hypothetical protein
MYSGIKVLLSVHWLIAKLDKHPLLCLIKANLSTQSQVETKKPPQMERLLVSILVTRNFTQPRADSPLDYCHQSGMVGW